MVLVGKFGYRSLGCDKHDQPDYTNHTPLNSLGVQFTGNRSDSQ